MLAFCFSKMYSSLVLIDKSRQSDILPDFFHPVEWQHRASAKMKGNEKSQKNIGNPPFHSFCSFCSFVSRPRIQSNPSILISSRLKAGTRLIGNKRRETFFSFEREKNFDLETRASLWLSLQQTDAC